MHFEQQVVVLSHMCRSIADCVKVARWGADENNIPVFIEQSELHNHTNVLENIEARSCSWPMLGDCNR